MENKLIFNGEVKFISKEETVQNKDKTKTYKKQFFIVADTKEYPNEMMFEVFDKPEKIENLKVGDTVEVEFNSSVKEYNGRYFGDISAWKVNILSANTQTFLSKQEELPSNDLNDLPF